MARFSVILVPGDQAIKITGLATVTASSIQTLGKYQVFAINADQDITINFGNANGTMTPPTTANYRIPANQQTTFDLGSSFDSFEVFNQGASAANVYIIRLSVV